MKKFNLVRNLSGITLITLFIFWFVSSCEHAELMQSQGGGFQPGTIDTMAQFSWIQANIFDQKCAVPGCHVGGSNQLPGSMDLREGNAYGNIVNVPSEGIPALMRVRPGEPDSSYIVWKIEGRAGIVGNRMPLGGSALPQEEIDAIRRWIRGATFNKE